MPTYRRASTATQYCHICNVATETYMVMDGLVAGPSFGYCEKHHDRVRQALEMKFISNGHPDLLTLVTQVQKLEVSQEKLVKALEFYADPRAYNEDTGAPEISVQCRPEGPDGPAEYDAEWDYGTRALKALTETGLLSPKLKEITDHYWHGVQELNAEANG